jgi:diguanylate cyclase (GGDEF)-like protein
MEETGTDQANTFRLSEGKTPIKNMLYQWRWYTLGREQYQECIIKTFSNNIYSLRQSNIVVTVFGCLFALYPLFIEHKLLKGSIYLATAVIALVLAIFANHKAIQMKKGKQISRMLIFTLTALYYVNIVVFGIYLSALSNPGHIAASFLCILICALFLFITPPLYNFCLTLSAMVIFISVSILVKPIENWMLDAVNVAFAGSISLFFNWQITKLRLTAILSVSKLEDERNRYYDQSTIDELTQLRNRRDFTQTFQRYLSSYRTSDTWLCIAIFDIDFFKRYNDHYGHTKGDDCLRTIGAMLNSLRDTMGLYSARVGGEEFALLWFDNDLHHANMVVARLNAMVRELKIPHEKSRLEPYVTISTGVYVEPCGSSKDMRTLYDLADKALYFAKGCGRNCAIISGKNFTQYKITPVFQETTA